MNALRLCANVGGSVNLSLHRGMGRLVSAPLDIAGPAA
jgi:hypothetical protein